MTFSYSAGLADKFDLGYSGHQLYDEEAWARELGYEYVWMNSSNLTTTQVLTVLRSIPASLMLTMTESLIVGSYPNAPVVHQRR